MTNPKQIHSIPYLKKTKSKKTNPFMEISYEDHDKLHSMLKTGLYSLLERANYDKALFDGIWDKDLGFKTKQTLPNSHKKEDNCFVSFVSGMLLNEHTHNSSARTPLKDISIQQKKDVVLAMAVLNQAYPNKYPTVEFNEVNQLTASSNKLTGSLDDSDLFW
jgi:hypothetical protein